MNSDLKKTIFVGLSGGVDSSVAAALLVAQDFDVVGVFMKNWSRDVAGHYCPWKEDLASARSVAAHLAIELKVYDFEQQYFLAVTKYMVDTYKKGLTPNPDIMCNQEIKFKVFLERCLNEGADMIATGHYAKLKNSSLFKAKDKSKDQTYFLYRMDPEVADKVLFPVGNYKKNDVRKLAKKYNLPTANRPDSQGLCFVGNIPMKDFLSEFIKPQVGDIVSDNGEVLGQHDGAFCYTIGQRHGLGIGGGKPYFVYKIDTKLNIVYVSTNESILDCQEFVIDDCVWWDKKKAEGNSFKAEVKVRYRSKSVPCEVTPVISTKEGRPHEISRQALSTAKRARNDTSYKWQVKLSKKERAVTSGQSAVFYDGDIVVGGGIIQ